MSDNTNIPTTTKRPLDEYEDDEDESSDADHLDLDDIIIDPTSAATSSAYDSDYEFTGPPAPSNSVNSHNGVNSVETGGGGGFIRSPHDAHDIYAPTLSPAPPLLNHYTNSTSSARSGSFSATKHMLTEPQQRRLLNYLDDELLKIQHGYVLRQSPGQGYDTLTALLKDLNKVLDVIWYSISASQPSEIPSTPNNSLSSSHVFRLFGQSHYLLSIADSLTEFITGYPPDPVPTIRIFQKLDQIFARLLDSQNLAGPSSNKKGLTQTEKIRLESIAERARIVVMEQFEGVKGYELEVSNIYELSLDRIT